MIQDRLFGLEVASTQASRARWFSFNSLGEIEATFDKARTAKDRELEDKIPGIPNSTERIALFSMRYQGALGDAMSSKLKQAFALADPNDAHAEAWYVLRYRSGAEKDRYYMEAARFGLYRTDQSLTPDVAKGIYLMYSRHTNEMIAYDEVNAAKLANANSKLLGIGLSASGLIPTLQGAADVLIAQYGNGQSFSPLNIKVAPATGGALQGEDTTIRTGSDVDLLIGGAGNDTLSGGKGNDILIGGKGDDLYIYNTGDGNDRIVEEADADGRIHGRIRIDNGAERDLLSGVFQKVDGQELWKDQNGSITLTHNSPWTVHLADGSTIDLGDNFQTGDFGIQLHEETPATITTRTILGDLQPLDVDPNTAGVQTQNDELGNIKVGAVAAPGRVDTLQDSAGNDLIQGLGGNDSINSWRGGDDRIEGGDGDDWMLGGMGKDIVIGGAGRDVLVEGGDDDQLYADGIVTVSAALAAENATPSGLPGEALSGGSGDDLAIGTTGNDVLFGGTGDDILIGGAGDDNIDGDVMAGNIMPDWSAARSVITDATGTVYHTTYNQFNMYWPSEGGADAIYAGAGIDWVSAGNGNDYVDGGNDNDVLWGDSGNDDLFGGAGADLILGDEGGNPAVAGDDYLDGEDGDDTLFGEGGNDQLFGGIDADELYGGTGDDTLDGEDGVDTLSGGEGADTLFGGSGNDQLWAGNGDDSLDGEANDDLLIGGAGKDGLSGGDGADQIAGDNGGSDASGDADTIYGGTGNDTIDGQGGNDIIDAGADNDLVAGGLGDDQIAGGSGNDQLQGGGGNDTLDGGDDSDTLFGQAGDDSLIGGGGNDYLFGGMGNDMLDGGSGDDVYVYSYGGGNDRIADSAGTDWLVFNDIFWGQITLGTGSLKLSLPDGGEIHLDDFDPDNPYAAGGIEYFQFADGTVLSKSQLIDALGIAPMGTPEADMLTGTALSETIHALAGDDVVTARAGNDTVHADDGADVIYAGDGNDVVYGGNGDDVLLGEAGNDTLNGDAGNDMLAGGAGTDALQGGEGDDTYLFQAGDGQDTVTDALGTNAIALGAGLTLDAIAFTRAGGDLLVAIKNGTDRLTVKDWYAADSHFTGVTLGDGTVLDHAGVEAAMPKNQAPLASPDSATVSEDGIVTASGNALANDSDPEGRALRVTTPGSYVGAVGTLTLGGTGAYSYTLTNGSPAVQSLAAGQSLTETFAYTVTDDDPNGAATADSEIVVTVHGGNDLPVLGADSAATAEDAAPIVGNVLVNDADVDAGTVLAVADPGTRAGAYGNLNLGVDGAWAYSLANASATVQSLAAGQSVTETFAFAVSDGVAQVAGNLSIRIDGQNDAPILVTPLADQSASANSSWNWQMPTGSFTDVDAGDVLGYTATLADGTALPSWLAFDAATQTFSGRVPKSVSGSMDIRVGAGDRLGATAGDVFTLSFAAGGGGGGGGGGNGGSQGNEGVGNGVDAPPPGHDASFNDGAGTSPGQPGAQGGNGYRPPKLADVVMTEVRIDGALVEAKAPGKGHGNSAAAHAAAEPITPADPVTLGTTDTKGKDSAMPATADSPAQARPQVANWLQEAAWAYLDTQGSDASYQAGNESNSVAAFARWLAVEQALARDAANAGTLPAWLDNAKGADLRGLLLTDGRFLGSTQTLGSDPISLLAGDTLKTFAGLGNGVQKLG